MVSPAPYKTKRQQLTMKKETTEGTDAVVAAADVLSPIFDTEYVPNFETFDRDAQDVSFSRFTKVSGERTATIRFATEVKGSGTAGTAPPNLSVPFQCAGLAETIVGATSATYDPASASIPSCTAQLAEGSATTTFRLRKIIGARGTLVLEHTKGAPVLARFEFSGRYIAPTDGTAFAAAVSTPNPEPFLNTSLSFQAIANLKANSLTIDMGNEIVARNDPSQLTGVFSFAYAGRNVTGSLDPEREPIATFDSFNQVITEAEGVLSYTLGATAGNIYAFSAPKVQITNIAEADRDALRTEALDLAFNKSAAAGDDEIQLVFT